MKTGSLLEWRQSGSNVFSWRLQSLVQEMEEGELVSALWNNLALVIPSILYPPPDEKPHWYQDGPRGPWLGGMPVSPRCGVVV